LRTPGQWFLFASIAAGPASILAMEAGWVVTEVGRQPWIVQGYMRTRDAVTGADGIWVIFVITISIYLVLLSGAWISLRFLSRKPRTCDAT
jgi:cytochrome d ubiquinol oxidase subunit I